MYKIGIFKQEYSDQIIAFFKHIFKENKRILDISNKDKDLIDINANYMAKGNFWCAFDSHDRIIGTIAIRRLEDFYEIRRFFVAKKHSKKGLGQKLLKRAIEFAIDNKITTLKAATMENGIIVHHIFEKFGFIHTKRYANSSAEIFYKLTLDTAYIYKFELGKLNNAFNHSLILNPTENIPMYSPDINTDFFEGLYVSERFKDVNDKVIFAGRNDYIKFFELVKQEWSMRLDACDVDLKTLSGLNAHLILFMCIAKSNDTVMLLPEICGGHFATSKILENLGVNVVNMIPNYQTLSVDIIKTKELIEKEHPKYIFIDRSEGLIYEDFSWLKNYTFAYKIFDASQYFTQILTKQYTNPFDMGFDMIISTLHKNYPGPQKGIIAVKAFDHVWDTYLKNAKTYISNTHPMAIAKSLIPIINLVEFQKYSTLNIECCEKLESILIENGIPVVSRDKHFPSTLHIWILCPSKEESYEYYLKLEKLNILTNYRLLPYDLGYGLRLGVSAAVRMGLRPKHLKELAFIMAEAYKGELTSKLVRKSEKLIATILLTGAQ